MRRPMLLAHDGKSDGLQSFLPKSQPAWATYLLLAMLGLAFALRVWGIGFGLPYEITYEQLTYEEAKEVHRAFKLAAGEYAWVFGKGGLYYILFLEYAVLYVVSWALGWVINTHEFALRALQDRTVFFLAGRLTVAVLGTLTCLVIFLLSKRLYDWRTALGTAFIGATAYFHTLFSSVINVDIGMTLALWASVLAYLKYERTQQRRWLIGAGVLGGISIAFKLPGAVILPLLFLAIGTCHDKWQYPRQMLKEAGIVLFALLVTLTIVAPEWTSSIGTLHKNFSRLLGTTSPVAMKDELKDVIDSITIHYTTDGITYLERLFRPYNVVLTISAFVGVCLGLWNRHRWDIIWTVLIVMFLGVMWAADRSHAERYMLPIMPALWLLSSRAVAAVSKRHWIAMVAGLACITVIPVVMLIRHDYEKTQSDTRVIAKEWIEANIPSGAKILMDGFRYRFIPSPPLQPSASTVTRQVTAVGEEDSRVGRGVSRRALSLYTQAMQQVDGPTYKLHSTAFGLQVQDLNDYVQACFDYVITSSYITRRFVRQVNQERFPKSVRFYKQIQTDDRFRIVYKVVPVRWQISGPTITVYEVHSACDAAQSSPKPVVEPEKY